jgi:flagellar basal body-associated protein FliL
MAEDNNDDDQTKEIDEANGDEVAGIDADEDEIEEPKKLFGKIPLPGKKIKAIILVVILLLTLGGIGYGLFAMGFLDSVLGIEHTDEEALNEEPLMLDLGTPIYYEQPEFIADLKTDQCRGSLLKISLTFQIDESHEDILIQRQPKIIDRIQQHLRSLTKEDLSGEEGANNLRNSLTIIVNGAIKPATVQNVLFRSFVIQ